MNMKNITLISLFLLLATLGWSQKHYEVFSPDKQLKVSVKRGMSFLMHCCIKVIL